MASLTELFSFRNISKAIESVKTGIPDRRPEPYKPASLTERVFGNETTIHKYYGERRIIPRGMYGAPSQATSQKKIGQQSMVMNSYAAHVFVEQDLLMRLRQVNDFLAQEKAHEFTARTVLNFKTRFENNRIAHDVQALSHGRFFYDAGGNLLQSSAGAVGETVDFGLPTANRGQLGGLIAASWANPATDIFQHLQNLIQRQVNATGRVPTQCFHGKDIPGLIYSNNSFKQYFQFNPQYYKAFASSPDTIPAGFMGFTWHNMRDTFYETEAEAIIKPFPDDGCTFTPDIDSNVFGRFEGSLLIADRMNLMVGAFDDVMRQAKLAYGIAGYSVFTPDPVSVKLVMVDNYMPWWKNAADLVIADVVF